MAYVFRRPTGGYGKNTWAPVAQTKADFIEFAKANGFDVVVERENVGEWNQCTVYKINGQTIESVMKGSRGQWDKAIADVQDMVKAQ